MVTSMISSMPEVAGDCAYYCDPYSIEAMKALETVLFDEHRQQINRLGHRFNSSSELITRNHFFILEKPGNVMQYFQVIC